MLVQTTQEILSYDGAPIVDSGKPLTFRDAVFLALNNFRPNEEPTPQDKLDAFRITTAMFSAPTAELSLDDAKIIKDRSGVVASPIVHGRVCEILERAGQIPSNNGEGKVAELAPVE